MVRTLLICVLVVATGCVRGGGAYHCASDAECTLDGVAGVCSAVGYCSFPDPLCESGYRYGVHAATYANECVIADVATEVTIGGTVTNLIGSNLVLRNNGGDDLLVTIPGAFTFGETVLTGVPYEVSVAAQPSTPSQTCSVSMGMGVAGTAAVTDVAVDCATTTYTVGGTVLGLVGSGMVLTNNGGDDKTVTGSGTVGFMFNTSVPSGTMFAVAIKTQPSGQTCNVSGGAGTVGAASINSVVINCNAGTFTVGGMVSGLQGTVVLKNNLTDTATVTANGGFAFPMPYASTTGYSVTVGTQPSYPPRSQICIVTAGTGTVASSNVTSINVACTTTSFTVGGNVTGLTGSLTIKNGTDMMTLTMPGAFTFGTAVPSGNTYSVQIVTQPPGQTCSVTGGATGTVANGNVTNIAISCTGVAADPGILCGTVYCDPAAGQLCCITNGTPACASSCNGGGTTPIRCDDQSDCAAAGTPALVCCGSVTGTTVNNVYCSGLSQCVSPKAFYCDPAAANPCPNGGSCAATMYPFPGYYRCF